MVMSETVISSPTKEVVIGPDRPFVIIGERINPTGRKLLAAEMKEHGALVGLVLAEADGPEEHVGEAIAVHIARAGHGVTEVHVIDLADALPGGLGGHALGAAQEEERGRVARELHDGMNQLITLALLKLAQLKDATIGQAHDLASEIESIVEKAGQETRSLTYQLSPPILYDLGFEPAHLFEGSSV